MARTKKRTRRRARSNPRGILQVTQKGYGFAQTAEGEFFVPESKMGGAFDGDEVELSCSRSENTRGRTGFQPGSKPVARVVKVLHRAHETLVGRFEAAEPFGIVVPENTRIPYDIITCLADAPQVKTDDVVRVRITGYPSRRQAATGVIEEVIGHADDADLFIDLIIARHKLETKFSEASLEQAREAILDEEQARMEGYRDVCERQTFTIDPVDARDYDDALSLERVGNLWRLGVHIADVSHYVPWGSSLDLDARRRATSVYLVDRAIPMLPEDLSSNLCSLRPQEVRRAMTVDLYLTDETNLDHYEIYPSLIKSDNRFTYDEVQQVFDEGESKTISDDYYHVFQNLDFLTTLLAKKRNQRGGIEFETKEAKVTLDDRGAPTGVEICVRTQATAIVEEAMILANCVVARHLHERDFPCLYRVHDAPSPDDLADLLEVLYEFSYLKDIPASRLLAGDPFCIQSILEKAHGKPEAELLSSLTLRSMSRAVYSPFCSEHFGLAAAEYAHFTSPIRRYPDLVVHRMIKSQLGRKPESFEQQMQSLKWIAEHSSTMERIAEAAGRESHEQKLVELMETEIGKHFNAVISGVTSYGLFVRLENTAEGLVSVRDLGPEYFAHDAKKHSLIGQDTGRLYRMGQRIRVRLEAADPRLTRLDFTLVER